MAPRAIVAPRGVTLPAGGPNVPQTGGPGYVALKAPLRWFYDYDPVSGAARAQFPGIVSFNSGGAGSSVASFNGRSGAVTLQGSDVQALAPLPMAGVTDGSAAAAGMIGELINSNVVGTSLPVGGYYNIQEIAALTAGDWTIYGDFTVSNAVAGTMTTLNVRVWDNTTATQLINLYDFNVALTTGMIKSWTLRPGQLRFSGAAHDIYLQAAVTGGVTQTSVSGVLQARRMR